MSQIRVYQFTRWSGKTMLVHATRVEFTTSGGLAFWKEHWLVLAVNKSDWNNLREISDKTQVNDE